MAILGKKNLDKVNKKYKMIIDSIKNYFRGWFIGNFEPSILKTKDFEIGIIKHTKGEKWPKHYHAKADEFNVLLNGRMIINKKELNSGDIFVIQKMEIADPTFIEDCEILVIKIPSVPGDKYVVE